MMRSAFALVITLTLGFSCLIALAQGVRGGAEPLASVFDSTCDSARLTPCFAGIRVGETTMEAAREVLGHNPWITDVDGTLFMDYFGVEHLRFRWRDPTAGTQVEAWTGEVVASYNIVYMVRLDGQMALGELWDALGKPQIVAYSGTPSRRSAMILVYSTFFDDSSAAVASRIACPLTLRGFLEGEVLSVELRQRDVTAVGQPMLANPALLLHALRAAQSGC